MPRNSLVMLLTACAAALVLAAPAAAQTDSTRVVIRPGQALYIGPAATGAGRVQARIREIRGLAHPPVFIVMPPAANASAGTAAPSAAAPLVAAPSAGASEMAAMEAYVARLERRLAALDETLRSADRRTRTVVVLPEGLTAAEAVEYRDRLTEAGDVDVVMPGEDVVRPIAPRRPAEIPPADVPVARERTPEAPAAGETEPAVVYVEPTAEDVARVLLEGGLLRVAGVHFMFDESALLPAARTVLDAVGTALASAPGLRVEVRGHTDAVGPAAYNLALSERRADSVRRYLVEAHGIAPARLTTAGYGESAPIAANDNPTGRTLNRRVEFEVVVED